MIFGEIKLISRSKCLEKEYKLDPDPAVLIVRPRGWHVEEAHIEIDGVRISGGIFDFAVYLFHNP